MSPARCRRGVALAALFAPLLSACATRQFAPAGPVQPTPQSSPAAVAANDGLNAVLWLQSSTESELVAREVYRAAGERLATALADPAWDALPPSERDRPASGLPAAVIVDVDETVLDNSPYQAELVRSGKEFAEASWGEWCRRQAAQPVPGALEFARLAASLGVTMVYVTNRSADLAPATVANLRSAGFPVRDERALLPAGMVVEGCQGTRSAKGCRRRFVGRDYRVLMQFGDQITDLVDVPENTVAGRRQAMAPYDHWIGERWWILANPSYGSWEPAVFGNDWRLPVEQRRERKIQALR